MRIILLLTILVFIPIVSNAENAIDRGASEAWIMGRLDAINELLQYERPAEQEAQLLYEKATLMNKAYKPKVGLSIMTECIIEAIELDPDNKKYKEYLRKIYETEWKGRYFHGKDGYSNNMIKLRNKVESYLER